MTLSQFTVTTILIASCGLLIANSKASAARASGKWCENNAATAARLAATSFIASRKSPAVAQLEPMTSISFSGKAPGLTGTVPDDMPTTTTRPAADTSLDRLRQDAGLAAGLDHERRPLAAGPVACLFL